MNFPRKVEIKRFAPSLRFSSKVPIYDRYHILEEDIRYYDSQLEEVMARVNELRTDRRHAQAEFYRVCSWLAEYHEKIKQSVKSEEDDNSPPAAGCEAIAQINYTKDSDCRPHSCTGGAHQPKCSQRFYDAPPAAALPYCLMGERFGQRAGLNWDFANKKPFDSYKSRIPQEGWPIRHQHLTDFVPPEKKEEEPPAEVEDQSMLSPDHPGQNDTEDIAKVRKCLERLQSRTKHPRDCKFSSDSDEGPQQPHLPVIYPPYRKFQRGYLPYEEPDYPPFMLVDSFTQKNEKRRKRAERQTAKSSLEPLSTDSDGTPEKIRVKDLAKKSRDHDELPGAADKGSLSSVDENEHDTTQESNSELCEIIVTPDMTHYEDPVLFCKTPDCDKLLEEAYQESLRCACEVDHDKSKEPESEPFEIIDAPEKIRYRRPVLVYKSPDCDEILEEAYQESMRSVREVEPKQSKESEFEPYKTFDALKTVRYHEPIFSKIPNCDEELQKAYGSPTRIFCEVKPGKSQSETTDAPKKVQREDSVQVKEIPDCVEPFQNSMKRVFFVAAPAKSGASAPESELRSSSHPGISVVGRAQVDAPGRAQLDDSAEADENQDCIELVADAYMEYMRNSPKSPELQIPSSPDYTMEDFNEL